MIELPEAVVIAGQITETLNGKKIDHVVANASPHRFAWFTGDPAKYNDKLAGKVIGKGRGVGGQIKFEAGDMVVSIGAPILYHSEGEKRPKKHQLLIEFEDGTAISSCAQMWGGFFCFPAGGKCGFPDYEIGLTKPSPLTNAFDRAYFDTLFDEDTPGLSAKAFLATKQRIPGLGNGVLQDFLWTARIHPKRKIRDLTKKDVQAVFRGVRRVLADMTKLGGRDTERGLFGNPGGYVTILCKNTVNKPCPTCGTRIRKEAYLGGTIYFCPECQNL
jgi:formamidopyrimidine-DNA glycosylase